MMFSRLAPLETSFQELAPADRVGGMVPNLEEDAISGAVRIWDVVGLMEVGFIRRFTSQKSD